MLEIRLSRVMAETIDLSSSSTSIGSTAFASGEARKVETDSSSILGINLDEMMAGEDFVGVVSFKNWISMKLMDSSTARMSSSS